MGTAKKKGRTKRKYVYELKPAASPIDHWQYFFSKNVIAKYLWANQPSDMNLSINRLKTILRKRPIGARTTLVGFTILKQKL